MKKLELKETEIKKSNTETLNYKELISAALNVVPQGGFSPEEIRKRLRVIDALDKSNEVFELEDADVETLKRCVKEMKWGVMHKNIVEFNDDVQNL